MSSRRRNRTLFDTLKGLFLFATLAVGYLLSGHPIGVSYLAVVAVGLIVWFTVKRRRERLRSERMTGGLCPGCGYDLRATPGRCPECGNVPA